MVEGQPGHQTTFISAYAPCGNESSGLTTVYQQHVRFIQKNSLKMNPKLMFRDDLTDLIKSRQQKKERVILMIDANKTW